MISNIIALLVCFQIKHFLADYPLQSPDFFIGKFRPDWKFIWPLFVHCFIHAIATDIICLWFGASDKLALQLALFNGSVHFLMDRAKASPRYLGRWKPLTGEQWKVATEAKLAIQKEESEIGHEVISLYNRAQTILRSNKLFWISLGFDQLVHHLTDIICIYWLMKP